MRALVAAAAAGAGLLLVGATAAPPAVVGVLVSLFLALPAVLILAHTRKP